MKKSFASLATCFLTSVALFTPSQECSGARGIVPGTGTWIDYIGDDFEDTSWSFINNFPKSSREQDERLRSPTGKSANGRWIEGPERGQPDHMKVVPTPAGGLEGSHHALLMRTLNSGIPGYRSHDVQQDDLIANCVNRLNMSIPVGDQPSVVARIYLPPADEWEDRSGPHFGFRISASTVTTKQTSSGFFGSRSTTEAEPYWPGIWIHFKSKTSRNVEEDSAFLTVRGDRRGRDFRVRKIPAEEFGWWTMGMSVTGDGMVHFYAKPGIEDLTAEDHLSSQFPYSFSAQRFRTFFFNACNKNDGKTWSTPFVIDDPRLYMINPSRVADVVKRKIEQQARRKRQQEAKQQAKQSNKKRTARRNQSSSKAVGDATDQAESGSGNTIATGRRSRSRGRNRQ